MNNFFVPALVFIIVTNHGVCAWMLFSGSDLIGHGCNRIGQALFFAGQEYAGKSARAKMKYR
ncbi:MAG: hypothetical protein CSA32_03120 [Desulfobulbus propionicus]|nr:MAG: hypothetical protein CSA32_03120 [Desulfobulbus propionicus]